MCLIWTWKCKSIFQASWVIFSRMKEAVAFMATASKGIRCCCRRYFCRKNRFFNGSVQIAPWQLWVTLSEALEFRRFAQSCVFGGLGGVVIPWRWLSKRAQVMVRWLFFVTVSDLHHFFNRRFTMGFWGVTKLHERPTGLLPVANIMVPGKKGGSVNQTEIYRTFPSFSHCQYTCKVCAQCQSSISCGAELLTSRQ